MPSTLPERFEAGTMSTPAIGALKKGIDFVKIRGAEEIYAHECVLGKRLYRDAYKRSEYEGIYAGKNRRNGTF